MKKILLVICLWCCAVTAAWSQIDAQSTYKLLWEVKGPHSTQPSYLFGTMHVTDERVFALPDSVFLGIQNTDGFALEVDFDSASYLFLEYLYAAHGAAIFDEGSWQKTLASPKSWDGEAKPDFDPAEMFKLFDRDASHGEEATFLDAFLYRLAKEQGKSICGLEDIVDQLKLIAEPEKMSLPSKGNSGSQKRLRLSEMIEVYEKGDLDALDAMVNDGSTSDFFKDEVIIKRNYGMATRADSLMHLRPTFVGVGAAHLPGDQGVIALLRQRGYRLRPVVATYTGLADTVRAKSYQPQWSTFQRPSEGYRLKVAARPFPIDMLEGKVKMYLGMDFAGGIVFCYYAMSLPGEIPRSKMDDVGKSMVNAFGKGSIEDDGDHDITYQGLPGKEYRVKKGEEHLRIRILFGNGKMYMLLLGNSKQVIDGPSADEWFNSLEFFESVAISQQPRATHTDRRNAFSIAIPADFDYESRQIKGFPTGEFDPLYNKYEIEDIKHGQVLRILCEDFEDDKSAGTLEDLMPGCIRFMTGNDLEPVGDFKPLLRDDIDGLTGIYEGEYLRYRLDCYLRYNRLYMVAIGMKKDDPDTLAMDSIFQSFHFLPDRPVELGYRLVVDSVFQALLPGKPTDWSVDYLPQEYEGRFDSVHVYFYRDPATSLNAWIEYAHVWDYFAGSNTELYGAIEAADKEKPKDDFLFLWKASPNEEMDTTSLNATIGGSEQNAHYTRKTHYTAITRIIPAGNDVLVAHLQLPMDSAGRAALQQFDSYFKSLAPPLASKERQPKLAHIFTDMDASDSSSTHAALAALEHYRLKRSEFPAAIERFLAMRDNDAFGPDELLLDMILKANDRAILPQLQALYTGLPQDAPQRIDILLSLMLRDWPGANDWAIAQLKADPSSLDHAGMFFSWTTYLGADTTGERLGDIDFLLDLPAYAIGLASDASSTAYDAGFDYSAYHDKFIAILDAAIAGRIPSDENTMLDLNCYQLLNYLSSRAAIGWQQLAHQTIQFSDGYLPGSAMQMLALSDELPPQKEIKHVLSIRESRDYAFQYLLENGHADALHGKYRKPEFVAAVALDLALEEYPPQVELVEKRKIYFEGRDQWLFIYRFASEGDRDWTLGFSGPVPLKGLPSEAYLSLSGSDYDVYSPITYKKKTKAWIKQAVGE